MSVKILDPDIDREEWDAVANHSGPDVHWLSAYARAQQLRGDSVRMLIGSGWFQIVSYPEQQPRHFSSLFQYGGPIGSRIESEMQIFAERLSVVAEYGCRLGGYPAGTADLGRKPVVLMDLNTLSEQQVSRRVRRALRTSAAAGAAFGPCLPAVFGELYATAMMRKSAASHWLMSAEQIAGYVEAGARFFYCGGSSIGSRALLTVGVGRLAYAHFLGSDGEGQRNGLDETLYFRAAQSLAQDGFRYFHLGGGLTDDPNDSLLLFKLGFSNGFINHYAQRYGVVFDDARYSKLIDEKSAAETAAYGRRSNSQWFPAYVRPFK